MLKLADGMETTESRSQHDGRLAAATTPTHSNSSQSSLTTTEIPSIGHGSRGSHYSELGSTAASVGVWMYGDDDLFVITRFLREKPPICWLLPLVMDPESGAQDQGHLQASVLHIKIGTGSKFLATHAVSVIGMLFGAIHLIAWNFHFPTPYERTLWRVFSIITTATPAVLSIRAFLGHYLLGWWMSNRLSQDRLSRVAPPNEILTWLGLLLLPLTMWLTYFLVPMYVISRFGLLLQSLVALRNLESEAKFQVQWIDLLPHL